MSHKVNLKIDWATHDAAKFSCENWHYSGNMPAGSQNKIGVWENGKFIGVLLFGRPAFPSIGKSYQLTQYEIIELVRIALFKHITPVSKILSISVKMIKKHNPKLKMIVSFADQNQGHHGGIYQGSNWIYVGEGGATIQYKLNGKDIHQRNLVHLYGQGFRKHPSVQSYIPLRKHKYLMPLTEEIKKMVQPLVKPYPKRVTSKDNVASGFQSEGGGVIPTVALQKGIYGQTT